MASKLDPFSERLDQWLTPKPAGDGMTLDEAVAQLKQDGCSVSRSRLGEWWEERQTQKREAALLATIATGSRQCSEVKQAFEKNPAPEMATLISLVRVLIMKLSVQAVDNPTLLEITDRLTNTVVHFLSAETKAAHKEREVTLAEQKHAETKKDDAAKALEFCLDEAKAYPEVQELFKVAFAALKKARGAK